MNGSCEQKTSTPGLLDHIDTISAARDLDILRAVDGQQVLTYLGFSYGTYLGATYAELFPGNTGRLVLDGAVDPSLSAQELALGQAKGFEASLRAYVQECQSSRKGCPLSGDVDSGVSQIREFLESTKTEPIPTSDDKRPLTHDLALNGILGAMYQTSLWTSLNLALNQAMGNSGDPDGSALLTIADAISYRQSDGSYSGNGAEALMAVNCLDYPVQGDNASWEQGATAVKEASPTFNSQLLYPDAYCQGWVTSRLGSVRRSRPPVRRRSSWWGPPATRLLPTPGPRPWRISSRPVSSSPGRATGTPPTDAPTTASRTPWTPTCSTGRCPTRDSPADRYAGARRTAAVAPGGYRWIRVDMDRYNLGPDGMTSRPGPRSVDQRSNPALGRY